MATLIIFLGILISFETDPTYQGQGIEMPQHEELLPDWQI